MMAELTILLSILGVDPARADAVVVTPESHADLSWDKVLEERSKWWSLQPVKEYPLPKPIDGSWPSNPIDRFLLVKLEAEGLRPAPGADAQTLARRLSFLLTGLPPNPEEAEALADRYFLEDEYARQIDRLLSSPRFGERWARHWMDVVGFAETHGHEWNFELRDAWRYRDYLIRAFNDDVPFNRLIQEHLAGDLLADARRNEQLEINESPIGTAFLRFGEIDHDDCRLFPAINLDAIDHQIDTLSKAFQATTIACARCHDHKLDAISMNDYYALSGILASSRNVVHTIDLANRNRQRKRKLRQLKSKIHGELAALWRNDLMLAHEYLHAANIVTPDREEDLVESSASLDRDRLAKWTAMIRGARERAAKNGDGKPTIHGFELPWLELTQPPVSPDVFAIRWSELHRRFEAERHDRSEFNAKHFVTLADFRLELNPNWYANGLALQDGITRSGNFSVRCDGDAIVGVILPAGFHSHQLSTRLNASLLSPNLPKAHRFVSFEVLGGNGGVWRNVFNNCAIQNAVSSQLNSDVFRWQRVSTMSESADVRAVLELATKFDDQAFPYLNHNKIVNPDDHRSYFGVGRVVLHDCGESPKDELQHLSGLFVSPTPNTPEALADRYATVLRDAIDDWSHQKATDHQVRLINWMLEHGLLTNSRSAVPEMLTLTDAYRLVEKQLEPGRTVAGVAEFESGFDVPVRLQGDVSKPGELVARRYVEVLSPSVDVPYNDNASGDDRRAKGSGRLELANHMVSEQNPLTARVYVNRVWHHVFGKGLVGTPDDFGRLGETPSHPELLDYLARRFVERGWSTKQLVRLLVTSRAYQMSSTPSAGAAEREPTNRLLHHYPMRRLEAEAIRDSILAVSGRLDGRLYGRSIHPYRFDERPMRRLFRGPLDGHGRRSIYLKVTLTEEPPFLSVFNLPDPKMTKGRRDITNVPAQALSLLNDPFVIGQAESWAERLVERQSQSLDNRIRHMFFAAIARAPSDNELSRLRNVTSQYAALHAIAPEEVLGSKKVWKELAHTFFNLKEFVFIR